VGAGAEQPTSAKAATTSIAAMAKALIFMEFPPRYAACAAF
jgi:hypothetical protein